MDGLHPELTEDGIAQELAQHYQVENLEDVRIIRDRTTKESRGFGFLRFSSLQDARALIERNQGILYLYGSTSSANHDEAARVRINYTREKGSSAREPMEGEWTCRICNVLNFATRTRCFRCSGFKNDVSVAAEQLRAVNVGDNDASPDNTPSQFLLLRGLEPSVREELLAKGVAKLYKPSASSAQSNQTSKKGAKVSSTTGDSNLGAREGSLRRVLLVRDRKTDDSWRFGFAEFANVEDAQAALIRYNSFEKFTIASKPVLVSYIHAGVFVPVLDPYSIDPKFTFSPLANPAMRLAYWDEGAYTTELVVNKADEPIPSRKEDTDEVAKSKEAEKSKKRKAEAASSNAATTKKAAPSHLQFWSNRHAELHGLGKKPAEGGLIKLDPNDQENAKSAPKQSYSDPNRMCCYLCYRQFKTSAEVNRHERLSKLHRQNLKNEALVSRALRKLEKHGVSQTTEYRDRARERRKAFGVQKRQADPSKTNTPAKPITLDLESPTATPNTQSKGASLLNKMGYTGTGGLGASGSGMTAPISQDVYVAGVGLGAQGGKLGDAVTEAERNTKGDYGSFLERTREGARERYERMQQ